MKQVVINSEKMRRVLDSAAEFQKLVPDAVMVGGSAVSAHIGHRQSFDGVEAGLRQLRRHRPLETEELTVSGRNGAPPS